MDPFTIAALVAAVAGAGLQYQASSDAQKRQQQAIRESLDSQRKLQMKAEGKALERAEDYETPKRMVEQQQLADEITTNLVAPVSESQQIRAQEQTTQGNVSESYDTAKAASDLNTMKQAEQLARMLGKTTSAGRLRLNEGIRLMDTGIDVNQLGSFSRGQAGADQIAINQAGQLDPGKVLLGSLLQAGGTAGFMAGGSSAAPKMTGATYGGVNNSAGNFASAFA